MTDPKQHHYIPITYLGGFCSKDSTLWVYDKWTGKSFPSQAHLDRAGRCRHRLWRGSLTGRMLLSCRDQEALSSKTSRRNLASLVGWGAEQVPKTSIGRLVLVRWRPPSTQRVLDQFGTRMDRAVLPRPTQGQAAISPGRLYFPVERRVSRLRP
jgi:hypothetical protein